MDLWSKDLEEPGAFFTQWLTTTKHSYSWAKVAFLDPNHNPCVLKDIKLLQCTMQLFNYQNSSEFQSQLALPILSKSWLVGLCLITHIYVIAFTMDFKGWTMIWYPSQWTLKVEQWYGAHQLIGVSCLVLQTNSTPGSGTIFTAQDEAGTGSCATKCMQATLTPPNSKSID